MAKPTVEELSAAWEPDYDRFVRGQELALVYYSLKYRNFLADLLGCQANYLV